MNIDILYMMNFDDRIMGMSPEDFIKKILINQLNVKLVVVGFNYRFGYKASGNAEYLVKSGKENGFEVIIIDPVTIKEKVISSTYIRELIANGEIREANTLLGRPYKLTGKVVKGMGRGKGLGFPTANLLLNDNYVIPKYGVYKSLTHYNNENYPSVTNIGTNPTFDSLDINIETHILDFNENLYDRFIEIEILDFIREEKKFNDKDQLINQVMLDIDTVKIGK